MARPPRVQIADGVYHVMSRGARREPLFCCEVDCTTFLDSLAEVIRRFEWSCPAYCLMPNHYHLLLRTPKPNLARGMQRLNWYCSTRYNSRHDKLGHAFASRYTSVVVQRQAHLLELCRYIVLNPVRAGLVAAPEDWRWSSYRATAGLEPGEEFLDVEWVLAQFGPDVSRARAAYIDFVRARCPTRPGPGA